MTSRGTLEFWRLYYNLPPAFRSAARETYRRFIANPAHPGLQLERLSCDARAWSVRVTRSHRAVARRYADDNWLWFWIGTHDDFDRQFPR